MVNRQKPEEMGLGDVVRELDFISQLRTLIIIGTEVFPTGILKLSKNFPSYSDNIELIQRQNDLYAELNRKDKEYAKRGHQHLLR